MKIDNKTYLLPEDNFSKIETIKKQIVIGHTFSKSMRHFNAWTHRMGGKYKKTASFTIDFDGNIYKHFDPTFFSEILSNLEFNKKSIVILLENDGWLIKDEEKNRFIDWVGHIYNKPELVVEKRWRGYSYWAPYTNKQFNSTLKLVNKLCEEFYIPKFVVPHNTKIEDLDNFNGVLYKSNLEKHYTDLSPAWNFEEFKSKLEKNEK